MAGVNKTSKISADSDMLAASFHACLTSAEHLKELLEIGMKGKFPNKEKFEKTIKEAIGTLEKAYSYEKKILTCDETSEGEELIAKEEIGAIPEEVQDWLSSTFTKKLTVAGEESRHKFKSIANVIRAGILVDKIYRCASVSSFQISSPIANNLKLIAEWEFDVFLLHKVTNEQSLKYISMEIFGRYDILNRFKISTKHFENFLCYLMKGYEKYGNSYHNVIHAADVVQTVFYLIHRTKLQDTLTDLEKFGCFIAAMIHDYEHTGTTNNFHIRTGSHLAMVYNDRAVLENHHISKAFLIMKTGDTDILSNMEAEDYKEFRALVIDMVLATDMSSHFQQVKTIKHLLALPEYIDKSKALSLILHAADISHPCKPWEFHRRWTSTLMEEFFVQGDKEMEKKLPCSPLCDRTTTLIPESQMGFINYIVDPCFQVMEAMIESILTYKEMCKVIKEQENEPVITDDNSSSTSQGLRSSVDSYSPKVSRLDLVKNIEKRRVHSADTSITKSTIKKLKQTPWNTHITQNLEKWKQIASQPTPEQLASSSQE